MTTLPLCVSVFAVLPPICPATLWGLALQSLLQFGWREKEGGRVITGSKVCRSARLVKALNFNLRSIGEWGEGGKMRWIIQRPGYSAPSRESYKDVFIFSVEFGLAFSNTLTFMPFSWIKPCFKHIYAHHPETARREFPDWLLHCSSLQFISSCN